MSAYLQINVLNVQRGTISQSFVEAEKIGHNYLKN